MRLVITSRYCCSAAILLVVPSVVPAPAGSAKPHRPRRLLKDPMTDYYPLIAKAVTGLEKSTGEARRALYDRARSALVAQLRGVTPALSESDITRERSSLEEAIRKVETEAARRSRSDPPPMKPMSVPTVS